MDRICIITSCAGPFYSRGLCRRHYNAAWKRRINHLYPDAGPRELPIRARVVGATFLDVLLTHGWTRTPSGCWEYGGSLDGHGYSSVQACGRTRIGSRVAYEAWVGPIPDGHVVCHSCDNPPCINPSHLFAGTHGENYLDARSKMRHRHKLTPDDVRAIRAAHERGTSMRSQARQYQLSPTSIARVIDGRSWGWLS